MENPKSYTYEYPRAALTSDVVVYGYDGRLLHILLIERGLEPYKGMWALPGGFMHMDETIDQCARRELREETGVSGAYLRQFGVFSDVHRDPRGRVVTVAFLALVTKSDYQLIAGDDAARAEWFVFDELPPLAFDHYKIIEESRKFLRDLIATRPVVLKLLDRKFTIAELQRLVEIITGETYDRRNFQRRLIQSDLLQSEGTANDGSGSRPAALFSVKPEAYMAVDEPCPDDDDDDEITCEMTMEKFYNNPLKASDSFCAEPDSLIRIEDHCFCNARSIACEEEDAEQAPTEHSKTRRLTKALREGLNFFKF